MKSELQDLIDECTAEIKDIESRIANMPPLDKAVRYLTHYALIKASGTAEFVYRSIVADYFSALSDNRIDTYLDASVRKGSMSIKYNMMCKLLGKFDDQWQKNFKRAVENHQYSQKIITASNSLVTNRHDFAHGKTPTATFNDIKNYYYDVLELIKLFDSVVC